MGTVKLTTQEYNHIMDESIKYGKYVFDNATYRESILDKNVCDLEITNRLKKYFIDAQITTLREVYYPNGFFQKDLPLIRKNELIEFKLLAKTINLELK